MVDQTGEQLPVATPIEMSNPPNDKKFSAFKALVNQTTTRGSQELVLSGESFRTTDLDFETALSHLTIHHSGDVAGSQFNPEVLESPQAVRDLLLSVLPDKLQYDEHNRAELTLEVDHPDPLPLGFAGVKSLSELQEIPSIVIERKMREPGGTPSHERDSRGNVVRGAWYPERDSEGKVVNPHDRFVPEANIATVSKEQFRQISATNQVTIIIERDTKSGRPTVKTVFPGQNAPPFPVKFDENDNFLSGPSQDFWGDLAFIQIG